jgi:GR25 family glycosyltransferase involved in LPS biosynthesis
VKIAVISLRRTPERWTAFLRRNARALQGCQVMRIDGVDGAEELASIGPSRLIAPSAQQQWTPGALGTALSHRLCWRLCSSGPSPMVVLEDDVVLAEGWFDTLQQLLQPENALVLLGWNLDSMLQAQLFGNQEMISLFEPAYPDEATLQQLVNGPEPRQLRRLRHGFGLPGYWLTPAMARTLLARICKLEVLPIVLQRGFPPCETFGIDGLLNRYYAELQAHVVMPPLALALNDTTRSLTREQPINFGR